MIATEMIAQLREVPALEEVPQEQLQWLVHHSRTFSLLPGELLTRPDEDTDEMFIIISGEMSIKLEQSGQFREIGKLAAGEITGVLPYSRTVRSKAYLEVTQTATLLSLHRDFFRKMIIECHELVQALVSVMTTPTRTFTRLEQTNKKMLALGKLPAGLVHELNNPSSAVVRAAQELKKLLHNTPDKFKSVLSIKATDEQVNRVSTILFRQLAAPKEEMSQMDRNILEDDIVDWLEENEITEPYRLADVFMEYGLNVDDLEDIYGILDGQHLKPVLNWVANVLESERLITEIQEASGRMLALVGSVKEYSHMDRGADKEVIDIRPGIDSTLNMLNHKLNKKNVQVHKEWSDQLPAIEAIPSELNQVWTNLLNNAIDAVEHGGNITLKGRGERGFLKVDVIDDGKGIGESAINNVFDPFFTTKNIGEGTGLGLDIAKKIIDQHNGSIRVQSVPGKTDFEVCLPAKE
jgi:signal transduction histidine kinase